MKQPDTRKPGYAHIIDYFKNSIRKIKNKALITGAFSGREKETIKFIAKDT